MSILMQPRQFDWVQIYGSWMVGICSSGTFPDFKIFEVDCGELRIAKSVPDTADLSSSAATKLIGYQIPLKKKVNEYSVLDCYSWWDEFRLRIRCTGQQLGLTQSVSQESYRRILHNSHIYLFPFGAKRSQSALFRSGGGRWLRWPSPGPAAHPCVTVCLEAAGQVGQGLWRLMQLQQDLSICPGDYLANREICVHLFY
ncbi:MAG: hypothetical protein CFH41_02093 [Alphaproteobacteria bacterium MarineAlpha11_Bin1]|nr:MAG: hypothetical protein CFH41_02093 [Alphaproteobacteria bacterium MarineAlpha11_Bin1]